MSQLLTALRIAIADDEAPARQRLIDLCARIQADLPHTLVAQYINGAELLRSVQRRDATSQDLPFDILLLDINMPGLSGLDIANYLNQLTKPPAIIFTTALAQHAVDAFELAATDYLLKPIRQERLLLALQKAQKNLVTSRGSAQNDDIALNKALTEPQNPDLRIQALGEQGLETIKLSDVLFLTAHDKHTYIQTASHRYSSAESLNELEALCQANLLTDDFYRCHRAYLVNLAAVSLPFIPQYSGQLLLNGHSTPIQVSRRAWSGLCLALERRQVKS